MTVTSVTPAQAPRGVATRPPRRKLGLPQLLLVPTLVVLGVLTGWPLVRMLVMSLQEYERAQLMGRPAEWVGLDNYTAVLTSSTFWEVLARSFLLMAVCVVLTISVGTAVALLMMRLGRAMRITVSIGLLLAWAMPALAAVIVWGWIFDTEYGVVNHLLTSITGDNWMGHSWLINPLSFFAVATMVIVWGAVPFVAFTLFAGFLQVPGEVLEAAQLDGAGPVARFRLIMVPYVRSIYTVLIVLSMIWDLKVFTQIFALQGIGGVRERTNTLGVYIYQMGMAQGHYGMASAIAVLFTVVMLLISFYYVRRTVREEEL